MAAICQVFRKTLHGKPSLSSLITFPVYNTWCRSFQSEFYRRHSLETLDQKKRFLCLEDSPDVQEIIGIEESTSEWKYVERLLPRLTVPIIANPDSHPTFSGWKPPAETAPNLPYYVRRQRNQLPPVYYALKKGQARPITMVKYIEGDIWAFESDLRSHLEEVTKKHVYTQVHEVANFVRFRGDYVNTVKQWLFQNGF